MKKLILTIILLFCLLTSVYAHSWNYYLGKKVEIEIYGIYIKGRVISVNIKEICGQKDIFGNCILHKDYYTIFLKITEKITMTIPCEHINSIKKIK